MSRTSELSRQEATERVAVGIARVSSDNQDAQRQKTSVRGLHARYYAALPLVEMFRDEGDSATSRTIFEREPELVRRLVSGEVAVVIADEQTRLVRGKTSSEWSEFYDLVVSNGATIHTEAEGLIDGGETAELIGHFRAWTARNEIRKMQHRVASGQREAASRGEWPWGGPPPLGYRRNPDTRALEAVEPAASAITEAFRLADEERATKRDIHRFLQTTLGVTLDRTAPRQMLMNVTYLGKVKDPDGALHDGLHPALVSEDRFERVSQRFARAAAETHRAARNWPFARIARCPACGAAMRHQTKKGRYRYVSCSNPNFPSKACSNTKALPAATFEANVLFHTAAIAHAIKLRLEADETFGVVNSTRDDLEPAKQRLTEASERLRTLVDLIADESMSRSDDRYTHALNQRNAAADDVRRLSLHARSHRDELEAFVQRVDAIAKAAGLRGRWIDHEHITVRAAGSNTDLFGDAFAERFIEGWRHAPFDAKRELIERTFRCIEVNNDNSLTLEFHAALPHELVLPLAFELDDAEARAEAEEDGYGWTDAETEAAIASLVADASETPVSLDGNAAARSPKARTRS